MPTEAFRLQVEVDTKGANANLGALNQRMGSTAGGAAQLGRAFAYLGGAAAIGGLARSIIRTGAEFEQLRNRLHTVTGSAARAAVEFDRIKTLAAETPFQVQKLTESYIQLAARGFEPTEAALRSLGDMAAAQGKDVTTAMQAVTQAAFGEAEMLKQFGIVMTQQSDTVRIRFRGATQEIAKDSDTIYNALLQLAEVNFAGAALRQMQTFDGAMSNLKDNWAALMDTLSQTGALDLLAGGIRRVSEWLGKLEAHVRESGFTLSVFWHEMRAATAEWAAGVIQDVTRGYSYILRGTGAFVAQYGLAIQNAPGILRAILDPTGNARAYSFAIAQSLTAAAEYVEAFGKDLAASFSDVGQEQLAMANASRRAAIELADLAKAQRDAAAPSKAMLELLKKQKETLQEIADLAAQIDFGKFLQGNLDARIAGSLPVDLDLPEAGAWADEFISELTREWEQIRALTEQFQLDMTHAGVTAMEEIFAGDVVRGLIRGLGDALQSSIARAVNQGAISASMGLFAGSVAGLVLGEGMKMFDKAQGRVDMPRIFLGAVQLFEQASDTLKEASTELLEVAHSTRKQFSDMLRGVGSPAGFFTMADRPLGGGARPPGGGGPPGGGAPSPGTNESGLAHALRSSFDMGSLVRGTVELFAQNLGGVFHVSLGNLVSGIGDSLQEAVANMMDNFAANLPLLVEQGLVSLEGIPQVFQEAMMSGVARTWEELQEALETASAVFFAQVGEVRADLFRHFAELGQTLQEAAALGINRAAIRNLAQTGVEEFINNLAGVTTKPLIEMRPFLADFAAGLEDVGIVGNEAARLLDRAAEAGRIYNDSIRLGILGPMADMARDLGIHAQFAKKIQKELIRLQFDRWKIELIQAGIWKQYRGIFQDLRRSSLAAVGAIADVADGIGRIGSAGGAGSFLADVADDAETIRDLTTQDAGETPAEWWAAQVDTIRGVIDTFAGVGRNKSPLDRLQDQWNEFMGQFGSLLEGHPLLTQATNAFLAAWGRLVDQMKDSLRGFVESLTAQFGQGTPLELLDAEIASFQDLLALALGGDVDAFNALQGAATSLLQMGADLFGTSTGSFAELFAMVTSGLNDALGTSFDPVVTATDTQTAALLGTQGLGGTNQRLDAVVGRLENIERALATAPAPALAV